MNRYVAKAEKLLELADDCLVQAAAAPDADARASYRSFADQYLMMARAALTPVAEAASRNQQLTAAIAGDGASGAAPGTADACLDVVEPSPGLTTLVPTVAAACRTDSSTFPESTLGSEPDRPDPSHRALST